MAEVQDYLDLFNDAYEEVLPYWEEAERAANAYNRKIDYEQWNTLSELYVPMAYIAVEHILPSLFEYLFPRFSWLTLIPRSRAVPIEQVEAFEDYLTDILYHSMYLRREGFLTIKDAVKLGTGYTVVEPKVIRPEVQVLRLASTFQDIVASSIGVQQGPAMTIPSCRHIPFASVVPMRGGNHPENVPGLFWLDFYYEHELRAMYEEDETREEDMRLYQGSVDEMVEGAKKNHFQGTNYTDQIRQTMARLANRDKHPFDQQLIHRNRKKSGVTMVPVLKCEFPGEHVWIANGTTIMYQHKGGMNTMRPSICKCSGWPDSTEWFTPGIVTPREDMDRGTNEFYNAVFDMLNYALHPARVVNPQMMRGEIPRHEPYVDYKVTGTDVRQAIQYLQPPPLDPSVVNVGDRLQEFAARTSGQPLSAQGQASPGLLRGGVGSFESLLQTSFAREKLVGSIMETGWLESIIYKTISILQTFTTVEGIEYIARIQNEDGDFVHQNLVLTQDEIRQAYEVRLDLSEKMRNVAAEETLRAQKYDRMANDPYFNPVEVRKLLVNNKAKEGRLILPREQAQQVYQQIQARAIELLAQEQAQNIARQQALEATQGDAGMTQGEQALAGGAAQQGGLA